MPADRFVVVGVARARSHWFRQVAQWSTSAAIPVEFVKCVSTEELRAHVRSGRRLSAALVDGGLSGLDRDLVTDARDAGCPVVVVHDGRRARDWTALGVTAVIPHTFTRQELFDALASHAAAVHGDRPVSDVTDWTPVQAQAATVVALCGPGGTGTSTCAIALAQELARNDRPATSVVLADLALRADQALLHDAGDIVPGIQDLVEAHREGRPTPAEVRALTFGVETRGYDLLLGLRRPRHWSMLRPHAFQAAFESLCAAYGVVVCDVTADVEGEESTGSLDVEERNVMARTALRRADAVVVVGGGGVKGLHSLAHVVNELVDFGVAPARIVPALNCAPRNPKMRADAASALARLLPAAAREGVTPASPVFLPRRRVDAAVRDGVALPAPLGPLLAGAVRATVEGGAKRLDLRVPQLQRVVPGSLGTLTAEDGT